MKRWLFYRCTFGGFNYIPSYFKRNGYHELSWGLWVVSYWSERKSK